MIDYVTEAEWLAATPGGRIQVRGECGAQDQHAPHVFTLGTYVSNTSGQWCPGQYAGCRNCDDRKCMSCCSREVHVDCTDDCPDCCSAETKEFAVSRDLSADELVDIVMRVAKSTVAEQKVTHPEDVMATVLCVVENIHAFVSALPTGVRIVHRG